VAYDDEPGRASLQVVNGPAGTAGSPSAASFTSSITPGLASEGFGDVAFGALHASAAAFSFGEFAQTRGAGGALWADQVTYTSSTLSGAAVARASFSLSGGLSSTSDVNDVSRAHGLGSLNVLLNYRPKDFRTTIIDHLAVDDTDCQELTQLYSRPKKNIEI